MNSRAKGVRFEREVADVFERAGYQVRGLEAEGDHLCVMRSRPVATLPTTLHVEAKRHERLRIPEWLEQVERDAGSVPWVLVFRRSRERAYALVPLEQYVGGGHDE